MDRDEQLDQDDYLYVPDHSIPGISADFLNSISGWLEMTPDSIVNAVNTLDKPAPHVAPQAYFLQEALEKEFIPPLAADAAGIFTRSEQILQDYARKRTLNATDYFSTHLTQLTFRHKASWPKREFQCYAKMHQANCQRCTFVLSPTCWEEFPSFHAIWMDRLTQQFSTVSGHPNWEGPYQIQGQTTEREAACMS